MKKKIEISMDKKSSNQKKGRLTKNKGTGSDTDEDNSEKYFDAVNNQDIDGAKKNEKLEEPELLTEVWRKINFGDWGIHADIKEVKSEFLKRVTEFQPTCQEKTKYLNILLLGQASSGKSSFINTCATALLDENRVIQISGVMDACAESVTCIFKPFPLRKKGGGYVCVRLFDTRGLHQLDGVCSEDIKNMCNGHIKSNTVLMPKMPVDRKSDKFRENPEISHAMHCVAYVASAENPTDALADEKAEKQLEEIRKHLSIKNVPQVVILNKVDCIGMSNLHTIFYNRLVKELCEETKKFMALNIGCILPMANYTDEQCQSDIKDFLALYNLWAMMTKANDYITNEIEQPEDFYDD